MLQLWLVNCQRIIARPSRVQRDESCISNLLHDHVLVCTIQYGYRHDPRLSIKIWVAFLPFKHSDPSNFYLVISTCRSFLKDTQRKGLLVLLLSHAGGDPWHVSWRRMNIAHVVKYVFLHAVSIWAPRLRGSENNNRELLRTLHWGMGQGCRVWIN